MAEIEELLFGKFSDFVGKCNNAKTRYKLQHRIKRMLSRIIQQADSLPDELKPLTTEEAVDLMRGPVGSGIDLTVRRRGEKKALTFNIIREIIEIQSVKSDLLNNNIGYIRLTSFNDNSSQQIREKVEKFNKNKNVNSFILDLRNNPGGLLTQAIKISDFFLENGEIVSTKSRQKSENSVTD